MANDKKGVDEFNALRWLAKRSDGILAVFYIILCIQVPF